jgi:hypothetical protein
LVFVDFCLPVWVSVSQESFFLPSLLSLFFCWVACYIQSVFLLN